MKLRYIFVLIIFLPIVSPAQPQPFQFTVVQPDSAFYIKFHSLQTWPINYVKDSVDCRKKKISQVTMYMNGCRSADRYFDTLGRPIREVEYKQCAGDTMNADITEWRYEQDRIVNSSWSLYNRKTVRRSVTVKFNTGRIETSGFNQWGEDTWDSTIAIYQDTALLKQEHFVNGKLQDYTYNDHFPNGKLKYSEDHDYSGTRTQTFNESGQPLKYESIYPDSSRLTVLYSYDDHQRLIGLVNRYSNRWQGDSTVYVYDKNNSLVARRTFYLAKDSISESVETQRTFDKKGRIINELQVVRYPGVEDSSIQAFRYEKREKNYVKYQYYPGQRYFTTDTASSSGRMECVFSADTVTETFYCVKPGAELNSSTFTSDSLYIPYSRVSKWNGKNFRESFFHNGKWEIYYAVAYDTHGNIRRQFVSDSMRQYVYFNGGTYQTTDVYDSAGRCTRAVTQDDSGKVLFNYRARFNNENQLTLIDQKQFQWNKHDYDSLVYDDHGRLIYEYTNPDILGSPCEYFCQYAIGNVLSGYSERRNGEITIEMLADFENGLPVSETETTYYSDTRRDRTSYRWEYSFYR
ncbi:MAG TPA: hypothetical protein VL651_08245 [Bacteroidia bacterium]|nr:hypothetical protein [Bacteroidia bacterium]